MTYPEAIEYLFNSAPLFQNIGAGAYKEGLTNTHLLDAHFNHPHMMYKTIHVAGTNGKGSVSHTLAAVLQSQGYKVGLYTSPHLVDFRERIRINGEMIPQERVVQFVKQERAFFEPFHPSFFELATSLAFQYFAEQQIDIAVVEVGLGGRLDCTNIITPILSVITNISLDHIQFLGDTVEQIAVEKAGIIKPSVPVVIGECVCQPGVRRVFEQTAATVGTEIYLAEEELIDTDFDFELVGEYQQKNIRTILSALNHLPIECSADAIRNGLKNVCSLTGLMGRWQRVGENPVVILDTGHNVGGWQYLSHQLSSIDHLHIVMGMVSDKDINHVLAMMPVHAHYYFTQASVQRAMPAEQFAQIARSHGLCGETFPDVSHAFAAAKQACPSDGTIFIGGSTFIVADYLSQGLE